MVVVRVLLLLVVLVVMVLMGLGVLLVVVVIGVVVIGGCGVIGVAVGVDGWRMWLRLWSRGGDIHGLADIFVGVEGRQAGRLCLRLLLRRSGCCTSSGGGGRRTYGCGSGGEGWEGGGDGVHAVGAHPAGSEYVGQCCAALGVHCQHTVDQ